MSRLLADDEIAEQLHGLPGWSGDRSGLTSIYTAPTFLAGIRVVEAVADAAEHMDHHPDIDIRWRTLTFRLSTHSAGGTTQLDIELAHRISAAAQAHGGA